MTEKEKMQAGLWFNANFDPALCAEREQTAELCQALNSTPYTSKESRKILLARLLPGLSEKAGLLSPFQCDYGFNITIGEGSNIQDNCVVHVDPGLPVTVGKNVTVGHGAILHGCTVGDETLIGMGAIVLNGAKIGSHCLIGAGALVTQSTVIPDGMMALGSPARVKSPLTPEAIASLHETALHYRQEAQELKEQENI